MLAEVVQHWSGSVQFRSELYKIGVTANAHTGAVKYLEGTVI